LTVFAEVLQQVVREAFS